MDTNAPILPQIEELCRELLTIDTSNLDRPHLLAHALVINGYCRKAQNEIYTGSKRDLACLLLETSARLLPFILPDTALLLNTLVGREVVEELFAPLQNEGWIMVECDCGNERCAGYLMVKSEFLEEYKKQNDVLDELSSLITSSIMASIIMNKYRPSEN